MTMSNVYTKRAVRVGLAAVGACLLCACDQLVSGVGYPIDSGAFTGWTAMDAGTANMNAVSGVSDGAVWIVGDYGTILMWDGVHLVAEDSGTTANLRAVCAQDTDNVYAVGDSGVILHRTLGVWTLVGDGVTRQVLTGVWADLQRVVAVGSNGTVVLGTSAGFAVVPNSYPENLLAVSGTPGGNMTIVGALGLVLTFDGTNLSRQLTLPSDKLLSGVAATDNGLYMVGQEGSFYWWDDTALTTISGCPQTPLRAVATIASDVWAVGWDGTICSASGVTATSYAYSDSRWFNGVYAASSASIWVVGASGTVLHGLPLLPDGGQIWLPEGGDQ